LQLNGIFNANTLCLSLAGDYCSRGRCCKVKLDDISSSPPCEDDKLSSQCSSSDPLIYTQWKLSGTCEDNRCFDVGACCTGGSCLDPKYEFPIDLSSIFSEPNLDRSQICTIGLTGNFLGHNSACTPTSCTSASDRGTCVLKNCHTSGGLGTGCISDDDPARLVFHINVTKAQCDGYAQPNWTPCPLDDYPDSLSIPACKKFFPGLVTEESVYSTIGQCCSREFIDGIFSGSQECTQKSLYNCMHDQWICDQYSCSIPCLTCPGNPLPSFSYQVKFTPSSTCETECQFPTTLTSIYAGDYSPNSSVLYGKDYKLCCPTTMNNLISGTELNAEFYTSKFDWFGYGNVYAANSDKKANDIRFKVYVYHTDLSYTDESGNVVKNVVWGQTDGNVAWGPHVEKTSNNVYVLNDLQNLSRTYENYKDEGYWQITAANYSAEILRDKSFNKQPPLQFTDAIGALVNNDDSIYSNNGAWRRNWGLYNTMRMFGADNAFYALQNPVNNVTYNVPDEWTAARLVDKLNRESTLSMLSSSWFIPSMEEMAFICSKFPEITDQLEEPIRGDYWTSTGTFDESTNEGKRTRPIGTGPAGTEAWVFSINQTEFSSNNLSSFIVKTRKEKRNAKLKVRPIRIEMINGLDVPLVETEEYKLWKLQPLKWVSDKLGADYV
jgi:hypothetical protein